MKYILTLMMATVCVAGFAQSDSPNRQFIFRKAPTGFVSELPMAPPQTAGSYYLNEEWQQATVYMVNEVKLEDIPVRLNLKDQSLEINHNGQVRLLQANKIVSFEVTDALGNKQQYVNVKTFKNQDPIIGFFQVVESGNFSLLALTKTEVLSASYNTALDVGSKDNQIVHKKVFYVAKDSSSLAVITSKKKMAKAFQDAFKQEITDTLDEQDINLKKEEDLATLVRILNRNDS